MPTPALFALATPIFGLSLSISPGLATPSFVHGALALDTETAAAIAAEEATESDGTDSAALMEKRTRVARLHRALGLSTWGWMTATVLLGTIQYRNLYGFFDASGDTPCGRGTATFGQDQCIGTPRPHLATALITSALYTTTFALSFAMPDPIGLDQGDSPSARRLRAHKRLRWAHLGGMVAQVLLGIVVANGQAFGLDRANDFRTLQALATVHAAIGYATYGTLTAAGALMLRR